MAFCCSFVVSPLFKLPQQVQLLHNICSVLPHCTPKLWHHTHSFHNLQSLFHRSAFKTQKGNAQSHAEVTRPPASLSYPSCELKARLSCCRPKRNCALLNIQSQTTLCQRRATDDPGPARPGPTTSPHGAALRRAPSTGPPPRRPPPAPSAPPQAVPEETPPPFAEHSPGAGAETFHSAPAHSGSRHHAAPTHLARSTRRTRTATNPLLTAGHCASAQPQGPAPPCLASSARRRIPGGRVARAGGRSGSLRVVCSREWLGAA